ncbi:response regulator [Paenibacillus sp. FSL H8-0079]|uniref:response regulator n=1 Tax=Paenibacillus sp. FSL H8-0079 TaxID=2921375 RepID=UPI0030EBB3D3
MIRVMLIDDEEDALDLLEILLKQVGNVLVVGRFINPIEAVKTLSQTPVDAVFLDQQMPGMNGMEVAREIRRMTPHMPIVFTTAYAEYAVEAFEVQSMDYLLKPFTLERLHNAVGRIRHSLSSPAAPESHEDSPLIQCLGGFHIQLPGHEKKVLPWKTKKEKELCAYLIHNAGKSSSTSAILEAIWPGYDLKKAKTYVYTCLSYLRRSLAEHNIPIRIHKANQGFVADCEAVQIDAKGFEQMLSQYPYDTRLEKEWDTTLYDSINLIYKGEYMEACDFRWAEARRMEIQSAYVRALRKWHVHFRFQGQIALAVNSLERILTITPDSEQDGRELIRMHLEMGNRNEANRVCLQLEDAVCSQLGTELEEETLQLIRQTKVNALRQGS